MKIEQFIDFEGIEHILIKTDDETYTTMLKSTYDEMIAAQSTPSVE
jgi:rhamnogalacturonyl hydrolase YesR